MSRTARESKAELTHVTAMKIVAAEKAQQQSKTARLRKLRLTQEHLSEKCEAVFGQSDAKQKDRAPSRSHRTSGALGAGKNDKPRKAE